MTKLVAIIKATRRKFSAGFKAKVAIEALKIDIPMIPTQ